VKVSVKEIWENAAVTSTSARIHSQWRFDTVIVGCGTAGSILAARLTEDESRTVCVIEAGRDYRTFDDLPAAVRVPRANRSESSSNPNYSAAVDWGYMARSTPLQPSVPVARGKVVGGSSSVNGAAFLWPLREDLDEWAAAGNPSWTYDSCLPFLKAVERDCDFDDEWHGSDGPVPINRPPKADWVPLNVAFYEACIARGYPHCPDANRPDSSGVGPIPRNIQERARYGAAVAYLLPAHDRKNLTVLGDALVTRLVIKDGCATGVEVVTNGESTVVEGRDVVVSAGAVGSPQVLMLSGIGPAAHLQSLGIPVFVDLPGVGQNLRDHPVLCASWSAHAIAFPSGQSNTAQLRLRASTPGSEDPHDMALLSFRSQGTDQFGIPFSLMRADSAGELRLTSADPAVPPRIDFRHLGESSDRRRMRRMLALVSEIIDDAAYDELRGVRIDPRPEEDGVEEAIDSWMMRNVRTGDHISCTCKMGPDRDKMAVVDEQGRVYGIEHLRVIDSSIMIDCPRVNTNAMTMMIAEKLAASLA
jgi:choline dehydrogenase